MTLNADLQWYNENNNTWQNVYHTPYQHLTDINSGVYGPRADILDQYQLWGPLDQYQLWGPLNQYKFWGPLDQYQLWGLWPSGWHLSLGLIWDVIQILPGIIFYLKWSEEFTHSTELDVTDKKKSICFM